MILGVVTTVFVLMSVIPSFIVFQLEHKHPFNWRQFFVLFGDSYWRWLDTAQPDWYLG